MYCVHINPREIPARGSFIRRCCRRRPHRAAHTMLAPAMPPASFVNACGSLAPFAAIVVFMAPIPTIQQVRRERSVGSLPLLPYSSMVSSAFLWVVYGVLKQESSIWSANAVGLVLGSFYFLEFTKYAPKAAPTLPGAVMTHIQGILAIVMATALLSMLPTGVNMIGTAGVVFCIAMFASPLAALKVVLQTKSAKSIPLPFTLASLINCGLWSVAGLWGMKDVNVYVPNLLGLLFSIVQLSLKLLYGDGRGVELPL